MTEGAVGGAERDLAFGLPPRFVAVTRLGEGAEGGTWSALDADAGGRRVALKRVPPERAGQVRQAFRVLRRVSSPHLPAALELLHETGGGAWLVTGWIDGAPLQPGPVGPAEALGEAIAVAHALRAIHEAGTHHGDVSPGNVLAGDGGVVLTDFGQVGCLGCGTPGFLAPEALAGGGGPAADVFALGCLLCFRLFGAPPWARPEGLVDALRRGERAVEARLAELAAGAALPEELPALLRRLLALDGTRRLIDLRLVLARLQALLLTCRAGHGPESMSPEPGPTWWLPARWPYAGTSLAPALALLLPAPRARLVAVAGPPGSGRGRVVEELVGTLQAQADGPPARLCPAERLGAALQVPAAGWIEAWIAGAEEAVFGLPEAPPWPGDLAEETGNEEHVARRRAAVLAAAAAMARTTLIVPVSPAVGAALARAGAEAAVRGEAPLAVLELRPWTEGELLQALQPVLDPPEEREAWAAALRAATGGWPGATIEAIEASARASLARPTPEGIAAASATGRAALDAGRARLVLEAAWTAEGREAAMATGAGLQAAHLFAPGGVPLAWALAAARRAFGPRVRELARERLAELEEAAGREGHGEENMSSGTRVTLALAVDADSPAAVSRWLADCPEAGGAWERDPALPRLLERIDSGLPDASRAKLAAALLRAGQAGRALALAEKGGPRCALVAARALEQTGRAGEALTRLDALLAEPALPGDLRGTALGLRWRALTDLGRASEAVVEVQRLASSEVARETGPIGQAEELAEETDGPGEGAGVDRLVGETGVTSASAGPASRASGGTPASGAVGTSGVLEGPGTSERDPRESGEAGSQASGRSAALGMSKGAGSIEQDLREMDEAGALAGGRSGTNGMSEGTCSNEHEPEDMLGAALAASGPGAAEAWLWAALAAIYGGAEGRAEEWLGRAEARLGADAGYPGLQARIDQVRGNLAHLRGQLGLAETAYERAAAGFERAGEAIGRTLLAANLAALAIVSGELGRGLEHGRQALRGYLALGRVQALPELAENLVQLLVRAGAQAEAVRLHVLLAQTLSETSGSLAQARLERVQAELVWGERLRGQGSDAAVAHAFAAAAEALQRAGATRDACEAWLRAAAAARRGGQSARAVELLAAAERGLAEGDEELEVAAALERVLVAAAGGVPGEVARACRPLADLPRAADLAARGRLELAWHYEQVLHAILSPSDPRRPALARRAAHTWEALMSKIPDLDKPSARAALLAESGDRAAVAALVSDLPESAGEPAGEAPPAEAGRRGGDAGHLLRMYRRLVREDDLGRLLAQVVDAAMELCDAERGAIAVLPSPPARGGEATAPTLVARELAGGPGGTFSRSVLDRVIAEGTPILSVDAITDDRFGQSRSISHLNLRSVLAVPLVHRGALLGALYVDHRLRRGAWGEADLARLEEYAELAALAIAHRGAVAALAERGRELAALLEERELEVRGLREAARTPERRGYRGMVGGTGSIQAVFRLVDRLADSDVPVVIYGESGTGKELVARAIHDGGPRRTRPFVAENCGAIPETLLESVLFGHAKGAFTGAQRATPGLFEAADGGTLFLDEIGEMSPAMQTKLLRVLQESEVRRVGDTAVRKIDVRVIAASNRDLDAMVASGQFRKDLLYRVRVVKVELPPLRARTEDLPLLIEHFLGKYDRGRRLTVSAASIRALARYAWPGNIRELENEVQRWVALCEARVEPDELSPAIREAPASGAPAPDDLRLRPRVERLERELIDRALQLAGGNQTRAATLLGLSRFGLQKKLRRLESGGEDED
ncbi:sigma 54-interacting transcriptional regulator [Nannocystis punicea]|uniref:Sigma 54-interacting transcriptional regulator n=1 Tax=Nannocystis punicea TaxID=2995304 RepID=A0ABY7GRP3_9BACT|nr:sigma 54-interacting transcriptional regulator [Nannocystis poenicansa]WAS89617.1 sigma 54-interacting transcriptional regulator [Nannocystis poenicansa]